MKKFLIYTVICVSVLFLACTKSSDTIHPTVPNTNPNPVRVDTSNAMMTLPVTFSFNSGDTLYNWSGNDTNKLARLKINGPLAEIEAHIFTIVGGKKYYKFLYFDFDATLLQQTTYTGGSSKYCLFTHDQSEIRGSIQDTLNVTVTNIHDSLVDGTFTFHSKDGVSINITEGQFKNIPRVAL